MHQASATRKINATPEAVWALIDDVRAIERFHPAVEKVELLSDMPNGLGAARRCSFYDGTSVREEVIEVDEGHRVRLRMSEYSVPMKSLEAEMLITPTGDGHAEVTMALHYEVKWGVLGKLMGGTLMKRELSKVAAKVLAGLDHHVTSGETVDENWVPRAA